MLMIFIVEIYWIMVCALFAMEGNRQDLNALWDCWECQVYLDSLMLYAADSVCFGGLEYMVRSKCGY